MENATRVIRSELLQIVGAIGAIREQGLHLRSSDKRYLERELEVMQTAAHRLFEHLDQLELPSA